MKILVINAGSSSLKYQLINMQDESVILKGVCERITFTGGQLTQKTFDGSYWDLTSDPVVQNQNTRDFPVIHS